MRDDSCGGDVRSNVEARDQLDMLCMLVSLIDRKESETPNKKRERKSHVETKAQRYVIFLLVLCKLLIGFWERAILR